MKVIRKLKKAKEIKRKMKASHKKVKESKGNQKEKVRN